MAKVILIVTQARIFASQIVKLWGFASRKGMFIYLFFYLCAMPNEIGQQSPGPPISTCTRRKSAIERRQVITFKIHWKLSTCGRRPSSDLSLELIEPKHAKKWYPVCVLSFVVFYSAATTWIRNVLQWETRAANCFLGNIYNTLGGSLVRCRGDDIPNSVAVHQRTLSIGQR